MATKQPTRTAPRVALTLRIAGMLISVWGKEQMDGRPSREDICNADGLLFGALVS
jgi:hypothetical protein